jgi:hypothetical protein
VQIEGLAFDPAEEPHEGIDTVTSNPSPVTHKIIRHGQLIIIRGEKQYNAQGQEL